MGGILRDLIVGNGANLSDHFTSPGHVVESSKGRIQVRRELPSSDLMLAFVSLPAQIVRAFNGANEATQVPSPLGGHDQAGCGAAGADAVTHTQQTALLIVMCVNGVEAKGRNECDLNGRHARRRMRSLSPDFQAFLYRSREHFLSWRVGVRVVLSLVKREHLSTLDLSREKWAFFEAGKQC